MSRPQQSFVYFFKTASELEIILPILSSFNPLLSLSSATADNCQWIVQRSNIVFGNNTRPLFFWLPLMRRRNLVFKSDTTIAYQCPFTVLFNNIPNLKFKSPPKVAFFAAVNQFKYLYISNQWIVKKRHLQNGSKSTNQ